MALDRCAADFSISGGKHLIDHAVELAYRHKDILKAIISKIIPEATSGESASMRRIILLCPDKSGKVSEVISYDTAPMHRATPSIDCDTTDVSTDNSVDSGGGMPDPDPREISIVSNYHLAPNSESIPSQDESTQESQDIPLNAEVPVDVPSEEVVEIPPSKIPGQEVSTEEIPNVY